MDQQSEQPSIEPTVTAEVPKTAPPPPSTGAGSPPRQFPTKVLIAVLSLVLIGALSVLAITMLRLKQQEAAAPTPTPTPLPPTPTPVRQLSKFATESAFMNFETAVGSLSAVIAGYPIMDQSLSPPKLNLPLGFSK